MTRQRNRATKSINHWRSEKWEMQYTVNQRGESRYYKKCRARAQRRLARLLVNDQD